MAVTTAAAEPRYAFSSARGRRVSRCVVVGVIAVELVAWYVVIGRGGWTYDDNLYFTMSHATSFGKFVNSNLFGHWTPGYKAVFWLLGRAMPFDYRWALAGLLLVLGGSAFLFSRIIERLVGGRWIPAIAAGFLAISVLLISSLQWFSAGLQTIPTIACDLVCLWAYLRYQDRRSMGWALLSAASLAAGLMFYEKPALMPVFLLAFRLLVQGGDLRPRRIAAALWSERAVWIGYLVVLIAYVLIRKSLGAGSLGSTSFPTIGQWAQLYGLMWAKALVPAVFGLALPGGSVGPGTVNGLQLAIGILLQVVVFAAIAISIRRRPTAWRAWAALAVCIVAIGIVIGVGRFALSGLGAASDPRYLVELAFLIPLFAVLAFCPPVQVSAHAISGYDRPASGHDRAVRLTASPWAAVVLGVLAAGYVCASVATAANWEAGWPGVGARAWEANVESGLAALKRKGPNVIANTEAPGFILQSGFVPYDFLSYLLPRFGFAPHVDGPLVGPLYMVTGDGHILPARIERIIGRPVSVAHCGRTAPAGIKVQERLPHVPTTDASYYLLLSYRTPGQARLPLFLDSGGGFGPPSSLIRVTPGATRSIAWLGEGAPRSVLVSSAVGGYVCVRSIEVVSIAAGR